MKIMDWQEKIMLANNDESMKRIKKILGRKNGKNELRAVSEQWREGECYSQGESWARYPEL